MSGRPRAAGGASLRTLIVGGASLLVVVLLACVLGLLGLTGRLRGAVEREAGALLAEQRLVDQIHREIGLQLLDAAQYLGEPRAVALERFNRHGANVYDGIRQYLFRDLPLPQRLQVERIKELHAQLEVAANEAFALRRRGDTTGARVRGEALLDDATPLQAALDRFLAMRAADYDAALDRSSAILRRLYVGAAILALILVAAVVVALRILRTRLLLPLAELSSTAARIGAGELDARLPVRRDDELAQVAGSFNAMASGIQALQEQLRRSEDRYRSLVELSPDAVLVQRAGSIVLANDAAGRRFGREGTASLVGRPLLDLVHPDARARAEEHLALVAAARGSAVQVESAASVPLELPLIGARGGPVWGELAAAPFDYDGEPATLVVVRDATARKNAEAALQDAEVQLRQAQKMEAVGRLAGGIAHDFNNLLTVITSYGELLLRTIARGDPRRDDVAEIHAAARRAAALTGQLLAFSRKQVLRPVAVHLNDVIDGVASLLRRLIGADIDLCIELAPRIETIDADRNQMEQVVLNLALNARDAMPGGGQLTIATRMERGNASRDARVVLVVVDTGIGMDAATRERIFEPFFTTKAPGKGTGLGLSTVYGLVQQLGGELRVQSEPGQGSTFEVLLPVGESRTEEPALESSSAAGAGGDETVLVVEDEPGVRALATRVLGQAGYDVLAAADGLEAASIAREHAGVIHLLLTDVVLPGVGGRELASQLAAERPGMRVLFTSGYTEDEMLRRGVFSHAERFLAKPYNPQSLADAVRSALDSRDETHLAR